MINSTNVAAQVVAAGANFIFNTDRIRTRSCNCGGWLVHDAGSGLFTINKNGLYKIEYDMDVTSATEGTAITVALEYAGEAIGGTTSTYTVGTAGAYGHLSGSTIVRVPCEASTVISLGNTTSTAITAQNANIIIEKLA